MFKISVADDKIAWHATHSYLNVEYLSLVYIPPLVSCVV